MTTDTLTPDAPEILELPSAPQAWVHHPRVRSMTRRQMDCVLSRNHVARVAFVRHDRLELRPVHYVYVGRTLYGRTSFGSKGQAWHANPEVVVEVDEVEALYDWRSIIIRGTIALLRPRGSAADRVEYWQAVDAIRALVPGALTERDLTPHQAFVFRVDPTEMTGREAST